MRITYKKNFIAPSRMHHAILLHIVHVSKEVVRSANVNSKLDIRS